MGVRGVPFPPIVLDRAVNQPLYRQIEVALRRSILDGRIGPGAVLPGIRAYAKHLGVAAVTVMTAYEQLTAEGYLEPRPGAARWSRRACRTSGAGSTSARARAAPPCRPSGRPDRGVRSSADHAPSRGTTSGPARPASTCSLSRSGSACCRGVAGPRLGPGLRDDLSLPGGRPPAAGRARGLPRDVPCGAHDGRPGGRDGRRPERPRHRGAPVAGGRPSAGARGSGRPPPPAGLRGLRRAARPRPGRRPRPAGRPTAGRARRRDGHPVVAVPERRDDARRAADAAAGLGRPQRRRDHRGRL